MPDSEEDREALERYASTGDPETRAWLVERYQPLALYHARRFLNRGIERDDLEQVAMYGLLKAIDRFQPDRGVAISTYASRTIEGELKRHFRDRGWAMHVPRGLRDLSIAVRNTAEELEKDLGRPPRPSEIAERLDIETDEVLAALDAQTAYRAASLDRSARTDDDHTPAAIGRDERGFAGVTDRLVVGELLQLLDEREQTIVRLRFYDNLTQSEIGERLGISQMHVSRLLRQSLLALRRALAEQGDAGFEERSEAGGTDAADA